MLENKCLAIMSPNKTKCLAIMLPKYFTRTETPLRGMHHDHVLLYNGVELLHFFAFCYDIWHELSYN